MNEIHTDPVLDMKTLFAIYTDPDGATIIGVWNGVKMLAASDPEGCVRMSSSLPMDTPMLAGLFHCSECIVQKTLSLFEKLRLLTVTDGLIRIAGGRNESATNRITTRKQDESKETEAHKRELARLRQAERRARQKQEKEQQKENIAATPEANCDEARDEKRNMCDNVRDRHAVTRDMRDKVRDMRDTQRDNPAQSRMNTASAGSVTERDTRRDMRDTGNTVNSNINNNLNALNALKADKHVSIYETENEKVNKHVSTYETENEKTETTPKNSLNPSGNCVPWHPEENGLKIPLNLLPETIRNIINEYNKLPLPKYNGVIPSLLEKMKYLLHRYGERIVIKTIAGIANSTFLLGKKENSSWTASLSWLMDAKNFAKVYAGKYSNNTDGSCDKNWKLGDPFPIQLPGEGERRFTAEEQRVAIRKLSIPTTPAQIRAARLCGLPLDREAII
ncbi:phage replisome organizer N-terminal domain-containing protein [uncultured Succiniclasticum sp.]|uniref:phage replisome organizer N-terminal domain-containing protein n=1 Tax=uncultured Succiniclasticum sp. TaxID=1500547 RepID=UPI0025E01166|nr:phage replisome organizer N-terminal domain-containing protein [uncultured Succiniclasticum sp.]